MPHRRDRRTPLAVCDAAHYKNGMRRPHPGLMLDPVTRLDEKIDEGGQGQVWRGTDLALQRLVAVKLLPADDPWGEPDATEQAVRAKREARAIARLLHPAIAAVHRVGQWQRQPFLVMRWVPGRSLRAHLNEGPVDRSVALAWLTRIGHAVQHAHDRGVLHCDLKPENVVICEGVPSDQAATLVDFGLARGRGLRHRSSVQRRGSIAYLAPESGLAAPSAAGDQYALAVMACELLGGARPTRRRAVPGDRAAPSTAHDARPAPPPALPRGLPPALRPLLARALAPVAAERFPSVSHFIDQLLAACAPSSEGGAAPRGALESSPAAAHDVGGDALDLGRLPAATADAVVAAAFRASADAALVARSFRAEPLRACCERLRRLGVLERVGGAMVPVAQAALEAVAEPLSGAHQRAVHSTLAVALEQGDTTLGWVAEETASHWLAAGQPVRAARALQDALDAESGRDASTRLTLAERVCRLYSTDGDQHAAAAVRWGRLAARMGRRRDAEVALSEALGALSRHELPLTSAVLTLRALVRELHGEPESAADAWSQAAELAASDDEVARALVGRARSLLRGAPLAEQLLATAEARRAAARCPDPRVGVAAGLLTGLALEGADRADEALLALQTAVTEALTLGDPLVAADALLALAEGLRRRGRLTEARQQCDEADDALAAEGAVAAGATSWLVRGRIALDAGEPWRAALHAQAAQVRFADLGLRPRTLAAWRLLQRAATAADQPAMAHEARAAVARLRRRAGRPLFGDTTWWVDGPA